MHVLVIDERAFSRIDPRDVADVVAALLAMRKSGCWQVVRIEPESAVSQEALLADLRTLSLAVVSGSAAVVRTLGWKEALVVATSGQPWLCAESVGVTQEAVYEAENWQAQGAEIQTLVVASPDVDVEILRAGSDAGLYASGLGIQELSLGAVMMLAGGLTQMSVGPRDFGGLSR